jgi:hypothetical protein
VHRLPASDVAPEPRNITAPAINDKMNALKTFTAIISYSIRFVGLVGGIASNATVTKGRV